MTITNEIGGLQKHLEVLETDKSKIQSTSEESKLKRVQEISEIGNIIMSINNLFDTVNKGTTKGDKKAENIDPKYKTFDDLTLRGEFAIEQLENIKTNIEDKQKLIAKLENRMQDSKYK
jgi:hypothetical protein